METCRYASGENYHVCHDRDGNPVEGTDKVCFSEARAQIRDEAKR